MAARKPSSNTIRARNKDVDGDKSFDITALFRKELPSATNSTIDDTV